MVGADRSAVPDRSGKHPDRAALGNELPEVEHLVRRRLHLESDVVQPQTGQPHFFSGRQDQPAIDDLQHPAVLDLRRNQHDLAVGAGFEVTLVTDRPGPGIAGELQLAGQEVRVGQVQRAGDERGRVHPGAGTKHDAVGIDEEYPAIAQELTQDRRGRLTDHAIEHRARGAGLDEAGGLVRLHVELLPVQDRAVSGGDVQGVRVRLVEVRRAVADLDAFGVGVGDLPSEREQQCAEQRQQRHRPPCVGNCAQQGSLAHWGCARSRGRVLCGQDCLHPAVILDSLTALRQPRVNSERTG